MDGNVGTIYEQLLKEDWVSVFEVGMDEGAVRFDENNRFFSRQIISKSNPWLFNKCASVDKPLKICNIAHNYCDQRMNFIHSYCHRCYKVIVYVRSVSELFKIYDLQRDFYTPAKCGIDLRNYVARLYGAYFYTRGVSNGRECYKTVRKMIDEHISPDVKISLKRGCTEFEMKYGPSDTWKIIDGQEAEEQKLKNLYTEEETPYLEYPPYLVAYKKRLWLHWASDHRDPTVLQFTGGRWLPPWQYNREYQKSYLLPNTGYVTYEEDK